MCAHPRIYVDPPMPRLTQKWKKLSIVRGFLCIYMKCSGMESQYGIPTCTIGWIWRIQHN